VAKGKTQDKPKPLFKAAVRFGSGGWGKNSGKLGVKIPSSICNSRIRDEYLVNATLRVIISLDPKTDEQPVLTGMDAFPNVELQVKVNQYSTNNSDVSFGMAFDRSHMDAEFLKLAAHAPGSLYIMEAKANEDGAGDDAGDDEEDED